MENIVLELSKLIGQPINPSLNVPVEMSEIANEDTAEPGEKVFRFDAYDTDADQILDVEADGRITPVARTPIADTQLTFKGLNSQLEYVLVDAVLAGADTSVLARKKERISAGMDKLELRMILNAINDGKTPGMVGGTHSLEDSVQSPSLASGDDLYDVILKMKHKVEDFGDDFAFLVGSTIKEKIDTFDKDYVGSFQYNVTLSAKLKELGINVTKIFGTVKWTSYTTGLHNIGSGGYADDSSATALLGATKAILVARNSRISKGKPIVFVRRKINAEIAKLMGAEVDKAQRALIVNPTPVNVAGVNTLAYGVFGYESIIWAILNPYAICKSGDLTAYLH
jgi:energy-converting hydrogenase Eha subunit A